MTSWIGEELIVHGGCAQAEDGEASSTSRAERRDDVRLLGSAPLTSRSPTHPSPDPLLGSQDDPLGRALEGSLAAPARSSTRARRTKAVYGAVSATQARCGPNVGAGHRRDIEGPLRYTRRCAKRHQRTPLLEGPAIPAPPRFVLAG